MSRNKREDDEADDKTVYLRMDEALSAELDTIIGWMKTDPAVQRLRINKIGRAKALRYAVGRLIEHPPAHVGVGK